ncbi:MAG: response regulator transcription factor, partial [Cyclobacteriaceae bacterium]
MIGTVDLYCTRMANLAIIDDHALFRLGLAAILKKDSRINSVSEYSGFNDIKHLIPTWNIDVALVDFSMGKESGLEVAKYIKTNNPKTKVVILSGHREEFYVVTAIEAGVDGYIHKDIEEHELLIGIHKVLKGDKFYSIEITNLLINNVYNKPQRGLPFLTKKEKEVITHLMEGYSSKEIAAKLDVS